MKPGLKEEFTQRWSKYFPGADLPIAFYYTDSGEQAPVHRITEGQHCFIDDLAAIRQGKNLSFDTKSIACFGGKRYLGFSQALMPGFEYFLSCGIPGKLEGERYKKSPELVKDLLQHVPTFKAPAKYVVFKRWDALENADQPLVVIFFAPPDILSGLFTLANFDEPTNEAVFCPMGAGCSTIVQYPLLESDSKRPRAVLGMFDVSARPALPANMLTFSIPMQKFERMVSDMDESFLITGSWEKVKARLPK
ncbi:MAG TPA: DUF169 domain-containing protein [Acidobacteriota bacterium]|nr:DUF169 domain-containing protein [Acidobacteriota bacterium]